MRHGGHPLASPRLPTAWQTHLTQAFWGPLGRPGKRLRAPAEERCWASDLGAPGFSGHLRVMVTHTGSHEPARLCPRGLGAVGGTGVSRGGHHVTKPDRHTRQGQSRDPTGDVRRGKGGQEERSRRRSSRDPERGDQVRPPRRGSLASSGSKEAPRGPIRAGAHRAHAGLPGTRGHRRVCSSQRLHEARRAQSCTGNLTRTLGSHGMFCAGGGGEATQPLVSGLHSENLE